VSVPGIEHHYHAAGEELVIPLGGWSVLLVTSPTQGVERAFERVLSLCDGTVPMPMVSLGGCAELKEGIDIERWDRSAGVIQQGVGRDAKRGIREILMSILLPYSLLLALPFTFQCW
jgi:hypothetical protein